MRSSGRSREPQEQKDVETKKEEESHAGEGGVGEEGICVLGGKRRRGPEQPLGEKRREVI